MSDSLPPLSIQAEVSCFLKLFLIVSHSVTALMIVWLPQGIWWLKSLLLALALASFVYYWRLHIQRKAKHSILALTFYDLTHWRLYTPQGAFFASLDDSSFISAYLMVLNLRIQTNKLHTLILFRDSIAPPLWRDLYVRLRFA